MSLRDIKVADIQDEGIVIEATIFHNIDTTVGGKLFWSALNADQTSAMIISLKNHLSEIVK